MWSKLKKINMFPTPFNIVMLQWCMWTAEDCATTTTTIIILRPLSLHYNPRKLSLTSDQPIYTTLAKMLLFHSFLTLHSMRLMYSTINNKWQCSCLLSVHFFFSFFFNLFSFLGWFSYDTSQECVVWGQEFIALIPLSEACFLFLLKKKVWKSKDYILFGNRNGTYHLDHNLR